MRVHDAEETHSAHVAEGPRSPVLRGVKDLLFELGGLLNQFYKRPPPPHVSPHQDSLGREEERGAAVQRVSPDPHACGVCLGPACLLSSQNQSCGRGGVPACQLRMLDICVVGVLGGKKHKGGLPYTS